MWGSHSKPWDLCSTDWVSPAPLQRTCLSYKVRGPIQWPDLSFILKVRLSGFLVTYPGDREIMTGLRPEKYLDTRTGLPWWDSGCRTGFLVGLAYGANSSSVWPMTLPLAGWRRSADGLWLEPDNMSGRCVWQFVLVGWFSWVAYLTPQQVSPQIISEIVS